MSYVEELNGRVMMELTEILVYCHTCEFQMLELLKVANCIFEKQEFYEVVDAFVAFKSDMDVLEQLLMQVDTDMDMLQLVTIKSMVNQLKKDFDGLMRILEDADKRIENDEIDFDAAALINDVIDRVTFDVADYDSFEQALSARYFITYLLDESEAKKYGGLSVLMVESFKSKQAAYTFALRNGISKDMVWSMYQ